MKHELEISLEKGKHEIDIENSEKINPKNSIKDYEKLDNIPKIENIKLLGNKTFAELGLQPLTNSEIENLINRHA